ncbi:DUF2891 domain-containing protein [Acetobacteraceae bacterium KSS8]|uniref:DUF2891 domain-containing protein n=1 Tax=Endosaccharibacter trunci TaxID=2812733 RepID=A0ABT1W5M7_9PROT|nr:DUF2891 domain-containing protein [Acetobacteraceae bacterium KSS8]
MTPSFPAELAGAFARIALGHVTREYPHKADHVMNADADAYRPRAMHPIFFGSFDWHSCVHGFWLLARVRRLHPGIAEAGAINRLFADSFTEEKIAAERAYLHRPGARSFERPYGWAWLMMLWAELQESGDPHAEALRPLAEDFAALCRDYFPKLSFPVRAGTHASTGFALVLMQRYARLSGDTALADLLRDRAAHWFGKDADARGFEPSGEDFLSPILVEALAMARLLPRDRFAPWFARFLPDLAAREPAALFAPVSVSDRSDGRIAHLDGLNLSRAWCMRGLAAMLEDRVAKTFLLDAAERHLAASLGEVAGDYMGEHWLASFALLALTD